MAAAIRLQDSTVRKMIGAWADAQGEGARLIHFVDPSRRRDRVISGHFFVARRCYACHASLEVGNTEGEYGEHVTTISFRCEEVRDIPIDYALWMATAAANSATAPAEGSA